jgi:hypothetical protein
MGYTPANDYWDGGAPAILINNIAAGDYVFLYDGDGDFGFTGNVTIVETMPHKIRLKLTTPAEAFKQNSTDHRFITIKRSNPEDHVRNFRMIPAEYESREKQMPMFDRDFLAGLRDMHALRFMDAMATNGSAQKHWSDRPLVTDWAWDTKGLPLEVLIDLANTLKIDPWFCVPHMASDDYIKNMARLIKGRLAQDLKCHIDYSKETWHTGFAQGQWIRDNAPGAVDSYISTDLQNIISPHYGNDTNHLKAAYFMARTFKIFETEFSGAARKRLVTVGTRYFWEYPREIIQYLIDKGTPPDVMADVGYFNFTQSDHDRWMQNPAAVTAENVVDAVLSNWAEIEKGFRDSVAVYKEFNIPYIIYEGGQHMQPWQQGDHPYNAAVWDAQIHPKMYELYMKNFRLHAQLGCKLFMHYGYISERRVQWGSWGALENASDYRKGKTVSPKYAAITAANFRRGFGH